MEAFILNFLSQNIGSIVIGLAFIFRLELKLSLLEKDVRHLSQDVQHLIAKQESKSDELENEIKKINHRLHKRDRIVMRLIDHINVELKDNRPFKYREDDLDTQ